MMQGTPGTIGNAATDPTSWQVPAHEATEYAGRQHYYALVIPVINEGDRIRAQLLRTRDAGLPVDVVVADGGSTDGSLDPDFIRSAGVRAVLTKTGPGKLSAQLRMAYAWCLQQGYAGIVTIDGNGKDGVEAVADMVARLEEGCDYVQGSRYLPGGIAENTPLERTIANRLIHAPLLSIAGRHFFSDTTNGFRAYSARYLTHPEVRPFRDEFSVYGLLFYLTVRAGQLGLKIDQVPVQRRYPDSGKVPTKIGGLASKLALLGETVHAATGGNTPDSAARARYPSLLIVLVAVLLVVAPLFFSVVAAPPYSPDSWAFYELAQTVFGDFYRFNHFRSYASDAAYSASFPPLWPALIAMVDAGLGTGARTGLFLAFGFFVLFALVSERIGRRVTSAAWTGLVPALLILLGPSMVLDEMSAGRTIPLQLFLYALIVLALLRGRRITPVGAAWIGLLTGLAVLNRFDAVLLPVLVAGLVGCWTRKVGRGLIVLGGGAAAISPWVLYSLTTFGVLFATDNTGTATTLDPAPFVTDWWPRDQPDLGDDPAAWAARVLGNGAGLVRVGASLAATGMVAGFVLALAVPTGLYALAAQRPATGALDGVARPELAILCIFAGVMAVMLAPQILTGFFEFRYFTALAWAIFLVGASWVVTRGVTQRQRAVFARLAFAVAGLVSLAASLLQFTGSFSDERAVWSDFDAAQDVQVLARCLRDDPQARILVIGDDGLAARAGAQAGLHTMMEPRNMATGRLGQAGSRAFLEEWQVDYVLMADPVQEERMQQLAQLEPVPDCTCLLYMRRESR